MKILALETSTEQCSAALWCEGAVETRVAQAGQRNSEVLLPMVKALLASQNLKIKDIDGIAFGAGPGSFTGLRIACGVAQGLAFGMSVPVVGISTLLAVAHASGAARVVCCLDARMGEVYHAAYEQDGDGWRTVHEPGLYAPQDVPPLPTSLSNAGWTGCGSGFNAHRTVLEHRYGTQLDSIMDALAPYADAVAALAAREFALGHGMSAEHALPIYVRDKVALRVDER